MYTEESKHGNIDNKVWSVTLKLDGNLPEFITHVFDEATEEVVSVEVVGNVHNQLRHRVEHRHEDVRQTQVNDKPLHPGQLLSAQAQNHKNEDVPEQGEIQNGGLQRDFHFSQLLVSVEVAAFRVVAGHVH